MPASQHSCPPLSPRGAGHFLCPKNKKPPAQRHDVETEEIESERTRLMAEGVTAG